MTQAVYNATIYSVCLQGAWWNFTSATSAKLWLSQQEETHVKASTVHCTQGYWSGDEFLKLQVR